MLGSPTIAIAYLGPVYMEVWVCVCVGGGGVGGGPQGGEVIRLGGVTRLSI